MFERVKEFFSTMFSGVGVGAASRHVLGAIGGVLTWLGVTTAPDWAEALQQWQTMLGAGAFLAAYGWSIIQKLRAKWAGGVAMGSSP